MNITEKQKKLTGYLLIAIAAVVLMGIGAFFDTVPKYTRYKKIKNEFTALSTSYTNLEGSYDRLKTSYEELSGNYEELKESASGMLVLIKIAYDDENWEEVVELVDEMNEKFPSAPELESAEKMRKNARIMIRRAEEEKERTKYETGITYKDLAFKSEEYFGQKVYFKGRVLQAMESGNEGWLRLAVNNDSNGVLLAHYNKVLALDRIYAEENVTLYGTANGLFTYTSTGGAEITIPKIEVERIGSE